MNPASGQAAFEVQSQQAKALLQSVFAQVTSQYPFTAANVFTTYLVASIQPKFGDSTIIVQGLVAGLIQGASTIEFNLARAPNGAPILLTQSVAPGNIGALSAANLTVGQTPFFTLPLVYQEPSPGSGTPAQYGLRGAANQASGYPYLGQLLVQEWR